MNYNTNSAKVQENSSYTWIFFKIYGGFGIEWLDIGLPYPNYLLHQRDGYTVGWSVAGGESRYLSEIRERFIVSIDLDVTIPTRKPQITKNTHTSDNLYRLADFKALKSIKTRVQNITNVTDNLFCKDTDNAFLQIKFYCEYLIKKDGVPSYQDLELYALSTFPNHKKGTSTLKAKCRSVFNWYADRDFKCGRANSKYKNMKEYQELNMATRVEQAKKMHKKLADETKRKVYNCISGMFAHEYKKPSGKWNVSKIAKDSGTSRNTVYKYVNEFEAIAQ
jgi:hypothetical protein